MEQCVGPLLHVGEDMGRRSLEASCSVWLDTFLQDAPPLPWETPFNLVSSDG